MVMVGTDKTPRVAGVFTGWEQTPPSAVFPLCFLRRTRDSRDRELNRIWHLRSNLRSSWTQFEGLWGQPGV